MVSRIIGNHKAGRASAALVRTASTPTPLAFPASPPARRDPPGGPRAPISLTLSPTPYSLFGRTRAGIGARRGDGANGVGGVACVYPRQGAQKDLMPGVRT